MAVATPASVAADGNVKVVFVPTLADPDHPTHTEVTSGSVKEVSCYLTDDGYTPSVDEAVITDNRLCSRQVFQRRGRAQDSLEIKYVYNIPSPTNDVARTTLPAGTTGYLVTRWGVDIDTAFNAADVVDVIPVQMGVQLKHPPVANSVLTIGQKAFITSPGVRRDVVVTAS